MTTDCTIAFIVEFTTYTITNVIIEWIITNPNNTIVDFIMRAIDNSDIPSDKMTSTINIRPEMPPIVVVIFNRSIAVVILHNSKKNNINMQKKEYLLKKWGIVCQVSFAG